MKNAALVGVMNRFGDDAHVMRGLPGGQRAIDEHFRKAFALDVLHGEVVVAIVAADIEDLDDVGVVQGRGQASLLGTSR